LHQADVVAAPLDAAAEYLAIEVQHRLQGGHAQHQVIEFEDAEHTVAASVVLQGRSMT
jgi:hypothetical protein